MVGGGREIRTARVSLSLLVLFFLVIQPVAFLSAQDLDLYREQALRFARGDVDGAAVALASWTPERETSAVDELIRQKVAAGRKYLEAAAMLETDLAFRAKRAAGPMAGESHLDTARNLLRALHTWPRQEIEPFERHWYLAVGTMFTTDGELGAAWLDIDAGLQMFPDDAHLRLAAGIVGEAGAAFGTQTVDAPGGPETVRVLRGFRTQIPRTVSLPKAEQEYKRALDLDGTLVEARLRLGRILTLKGDNAAAAVQLTRVVDETTEPDLMFLGHLFLGRLRMSQGDLAAAQREYEAARASHPRWPTAYIALSELSDRRDDAAGALGYVEAMATLARERKAGVVNNDDPWWSYLPGGGRLMIPAVQWLLEEIRP